MICPFMSSADKDGKTKCKEGGCQMWIKGDPKDPGCTIRVIGEVMVQQFIASQQAIAMQQKSKIVRPV